MKCWKNKCRKIEIKSKTETSKTEMLNRNKSRINELSENRKNVEMSKIEKLKMSQK